MLDAHDLKIHTFDIMHILLQGNMSSKNEIIDSTNFV